MSHYNNSISGAMPGKLNNNQIGSFEKSVMSNAKESIQKHLSHMKIDQNQLNYSLFLSIENFKLEERTDQCVLILLRHKANPNCQFNKQTPLIAACRKGQQLLVKMLLEYGAKPDLCNKNGEHPLSVILQDKRQNYDVVQTLLNSMTSINIQIGGKYPIIIAVQRQFLRIFQMFIQKGANLVFETENILHIIAKKKYKKLDKKKKFIKQLTGRLYLMQQDSNHKLPTDYEQNEQMKIYMLQNFKPKIQKQESLKNESISKSLGLKQKQMKNKESELNISNNSSVILHKEKDRQSSNTSHSTASGIANQKKKYSLGRQKQLDISSEMDEQQCQQDKDKYQIMQQKEKHRKDKPRQLGVISQQQESRQLNNKQNNNRNVLIIDSNPNIISNSSANLCSSTITVIKKQSESNLKEMQHLIVHMHTRSPQKLEFQPGAQKQKEKEREKQEQKEKDKIKKKLTNSLIITQTKKKSQNISQNLEATPTNSNNSFINLSTNTYITTSASSNLNANANINTKKKKPKNTQQKQIMIKTILKRKNSSLEQQNINMSGNAKYDKNKQVSSNMKKGGNKKQKQIIQPNNDKVQKQKNITISLQIQGQAEERRTRIYRQFQQLQQQLLLEQKISKQSQTDSQENQHPSFTNLNEQIYELVNKITIENQKKIATIQQIVKFLENKIKSQLAKVKEKQNARLEMYIYGSQSTGLAIQNSDVDLLVVSDLEYGSLMKFLQQKRILECQEIIQAKFITGATVPVIKIQFAQKFEHISADITLQTKNHTGLKCSQMIKSFMQAQPLLRPLVIIIKVLVKTYDINDPYKGGISSYAITLMVIALLQFTQVQKKKPENVGELLLNFFYFYGQQIDYVSQAIIIHALGLFGQQPLYCIYRLPYFTDLNPKLIIYDPLNPVNNVGRTTYRISALKKLFSVCYLRFKESEQCHLKDILDGSFSELLLDF